MLSTDLSSLSGALARALGPAFEPRPQQAEMARAVADTLERRGVLMVEAGTGVGKGFAYLVPAIERLIASGGKERVVVATNTIALQEQLLDKDIPLLRRVFAPLNDAGEPDESEAPFRAELVKGRGNYLSLRRLELASKRQERLFIDDPSRRSLHVIEEWALSTRDGSLSTLPPIERPGIWDRVQSDSGNCMGRNCPTYRKCFFQNARRRMEQANLLICNHALFFSDLALRGGGAAAGGGGRGFLPEYHHVILDEAHGVEEVASEHFGRSLTESRVRHLLSALWQPRRRRGYLATLRVKGEGARIVDRCIRLAEAASHAADSFFESLIQFMHGEVAARRVPAKRESDEPIVPNTLTPAFRELALALARLKEALTVEEDRYELNSYSLRAASIADDADALLSQSIPGCAYWVEVKAGGGEGSDHSGGRIRVELACAPIDVAPVLKEHLFTGGFSVVLTSATLTTGPSAAFDFARLRLGCDDARTLLLGSPFDHAAQVELHVDATMPDPRDERYLEELCVRVERHAAATAGGAFVLFTSHRTLQAAAARLRPALERLGMSVWVHSDGGSRSRILSQFRRSDRGVLLGTNSFWQGVDVPGRALRNVIITRLPFDPPDRPLTRARLELIESRGGNPFMEDSLPRAILRFRQGFGRLIRTAGDRGRVVVLDPRIVTARYGRMFLDALPPGIPILREQSD